MTCSLRHQTSLSLCQWLKTASKLAMSNKQCISKQQTLQTSDRRSTMLQETVVLFFFSSFCSLFVESPQEMNSLDANLSPMGWKTDFKACFLHRHTAQYDSSCQKMPWFSNKLKVWTEPVEIWHCMTQTLNAVMERKSRSDVLERNKIFDIWLTSVIIARESNVGYSYMGHYTLYAYKQTSLLWDC